MRDDGGDDPGMKKTLTILCGALALVCLVSLFIPIVAPRYPVSEYHPGSGDYTKDYFLTGDYYCARAYWSLAKFALASGYRIALSVAAALLLYWTTLSLMGEEARLAGVIASTVNLAVSGFLMAKLLRVAAGCRWGILIVVGLDIIVATVVAWYSFFAGREKRYIKVHVGKK